MLKADDHFDLVNQLISGSTIIAAIAAAR